MHLVVVHKVVIRDNIMLKYFYKIFTSKFLLFWVASQAGVGKFISTQPVSPRSSDLYYNIAYLAF